MRRIQHYLSLNDGSQLFYRTKGQGFPLVLLHGNGQTNRYFIRQERVLSRYFKLYLVDIRDHGRSKNSQKELTFDKITADLYALVTQENLKSFSIIGFSDGANSALSFASKYPHFVKKMVLVSPNNHRQGIEKSQLVKTQHLIKGAQRLKLKKQERVLRLGIADLNLSEKQLEQLKQPILLIQGERDIIKPSHVQSLVEKLPNGQFLLAKKSPHSVPFFKAKWFNQVVVDFLV